MRKRAIAGGAVVFLCAGLLASCGSTTTTAGSSGNSSSLGSTAVSESQPEEKQPYEILRESENETKRIAADEEQQANELKEALNEFEFFYTEADGAGDVLMGVSCIAMKLKKKGKAVFCRFSICLGRRWTRLWCWGSII